MQIDVAPLTVEAACSGAESGFSRMYQRFMILHVLSCPSLCSSQEKWPLPHLCSLFSLKDCLTMSKRVHFLLL